MLYKTKTFQSLIKKSDLTDEVLQAAVNEMTDGLIDARLSDRLFKKRIAASGQGKRGGFRTIVGAVIGERYFFLYVFKKNQRSNITNRERLALDELAKELLALPDDILLDLLEQGELIKIGDPDE